MSGRDVAKRSDVGTLARKTMDARIDGMAAAIEAGISPLQVADQVFEAIRKERFYILTEPERTTASVRRILQIRAKS